MEISALRQIDYFDQNEFTVYRPYKCHAGNRIVCQKSMFEGHNFAINKRAPPKETFKTITDFAESKKCKKISTM